MLPSAEHIELLHTIEKPDLLTIGIVHTQWNARIVDMMHYDVLQTLAAQKISDKQVVSVQVPGSIEIPFAAKVLAERKKHLDGIILLGCVIKGDTPHFEYVCQSVTQGSTQLNLTYSIPFIFGVLTVNNYQQAIERASVKGKEAAVSLLNMISINKRY